MSTETARPASEARAERLLAGPAGLVVALPVIFGLGALAVALAPPETGVAAWWPAAGASVLLLAWMPARLRPLAVLALVVTTGAANVVAGRAPAAAIGFGLANSLEAYVVAWWLTRSTDRPTLRTLEDFGRLVVGTAMGIVVIGLGAGATVHFLEAGSFSHTATTVMASHAAAILTLVPLGCGWCTWVPPGRAGSPGSSRSWRWAPRPWSSPPGRPCR